MECIVNVSYQAVLSREQFQAVWDYALLTMPELIDAEPAEYVKLYLKTYGQHGIYAALDYVKSSRKMKAFLDTISRTS